MRRLAAFLMVSVIASRAAADKQECLAAHEDAQRLRGESKLRSARAKLLICSADACPSLVKLDCAKWLPEVDRDLPTLIVRAKDASGVDVAEATMTIDGEEIAAGKAIGVDPGAHTIKVSRPGEATIERQVVVAAGEKNRVVEVSFAKEPAAPPPPSPSPVPWVLAGVGVAGLGGFAAFGLSARGRLHELRETCAPTCDPAEKRSIQTQLVLADVSLAIGVISLGLASYLFLKPTRATTVALSPGLASFAVQF